MRFYDLDKKWRVGRKLGRTIYIQEGAEPSDSDPVIGMMDSEQIADRVVSDHNNRTGR